MIDKKHSICYAAKGFVGRVGDILVCVVEGEEGGEVGGGGDNL